MRQLCLKLSYSLILLNELLNNTHLYNLFSFLDFNDSLMIFCYIFYSTIKTSFEIKFIICYCLFIECTLNCD